MEIGIYSSEWIYPNDSRESYRKVVRAVRSDGNLPIKVEFLDEEALDGFLRRSGGDSRVKVGAVCYDDLTCQVENPDVSFQEYWRGCIRSGKLGKVAA